MLPRKRAKACGADQQADQNEADDGAYAKAGEGGDHDSGRAEDNQRIAESGGTELAFHFVA
jgi:hypothetical protein